MASQTPHLHQDIGGLLEGPGSGLDVLTSDSSVSSDSVIKVIFYNEKAMNVVHAPNSPV